jgi:hypothetical protein
MTITNLRNSPDEPNVAYETVSPETADRWLSLYNVGNRRISQVAVARYANDMSLGRWKHRTGEPIIFDTSGRLQQGQHRLMAVVKSGKSITFMVVRGADPDDFRVLDQGIRRSTGQILGIAGIANNTTVAAIARNIILLREYDDRPWSGVSDISPQRVIDLTLSCPDLIQDAVRHGQEARRGALIPESQYATIYFFVAASSGNASMSCWRNFHERVCSGEMVGTGDPEFALRRWAVNRRSAGIVKSSGHASGQSTAALIAKAWNGRVEGKRMSIVQWKRSELPMPHPLPSPY